MNSKKKTSKLKFDLFLRTKKFNHYKNTWWSYIITKRNSHLYTWSLLFINSQTPQSLASPVQFPQSLASPVQFPQSLKARSLSLWSVSLVHAVLVHACTSLQSIISMASSLRSNSTVQVPQFMQFWPLNPGTTVQSLSSPVPSVFKGQVPQSMVSLLSPVLSRYFTIQVLHYSHSDSVVSSFSP